MGEIDLLDMEEKYRPGMWVMEQDGTVGELYYVDSFGNCWDEITNRRLDNDNLSVSDASKGLLFIETADIIFSFIQEASSLPDDVADLVSKRERAREEKNWLLSDKLRDELKDRGWIVEDTSDGSKCYRV